MMKGRKAYVDGGNSKIFANDSSLGNSGDMFDDAELRFRILEQQQTTSPNSLKMQA
jgi:hypothetical protein